MTRILIIDDHAILRMGLTSLLNAEKDMTVIGDASDGETGVEKFRELKPDITIMDLMMPGVDGIEATRRIIAETPSAKIMILTTFDTSDGITQALEAGALGAVMKNCEFSELVEAIRCILAGKRYISKEIEGIILDDPPVQPLSQRQLEILNSIAQGLQDQEIANRLNLNVYTVKEYKRTVFQKLGASNRTEAVAIALRKHLLKI